MNVTIYPTRFILEKAFLGSKSLTHRFLIASFLINEGIILENVANNDDINATISFLKEVGKEIIFTSNNTLIMKKSTTPFNKLDELVVDVKSSTSTLLFLLPVSLSLAKKVIFKCNDDLFNRSLSIYEKLSEECNLSIKKENNQIICSGSINLDYFEVDGTISSQFVTGLIINALYNKKAITINVIPPFICKSYVTMSIEIFKKLGFDISVNENTIFVHNYKNPTWDNIYIEADYSIGANFIAASCLNGSLIAYNFKENSLQYDKKIVDILKTMGGNIKYIKEDNITKLYSNNNSLLEKGIAKQLKATNIDLTDCMDLSPILLVVASFALGISTFSNYSKLLEKEKERVDYMIKTLKELNVLIRVDLNKDIITIKGQKQYFNNVTISSNNDHRIVMALSIFAMLNQGKITITNIECVKKSMPDFFEYLILGCKDNSIILN